jgi:hypothetical protein
MVAVEAFFEMAVGYLGADEIHLLRAYGKIDIILFEAKERKHNNSFPSAVMNPVPFSAFPLSRRNV